MLCVSLYGKDIPEVTKALKEAKSAGADIAEIRFDLIEKPNLDDLFSEKSLPLIISVRPARECGGFTGREEDRLDILRRSALMGADFIDVEFGSFDSFRKSRPRGAKIIISYHDFSQTPQNLKDIYNQMKSTGADVIKIATQVNSTNDMLRLIKLQKSAKIPSIIGGMGDLGIPTRLLYKKFGGFLTYCSSASGKETAPGQLTIEEMQDLYRVKSINKDTKIWGLIGNPVSYSLGFSLFNQLFKEFKMNSIYIPIPLDGPHYLKEVFKELGLSGASITMPYKIDTLKFLDELNQQAKKIGAVNTVIAKDGKLVGFNTDWIGARRSLREKFPQGVTGKKALVIGAGGAGRALIYALLTEKAQVLVTNRTFETAESLARESHIRAIKLDEIYKTDFDIVINTTSCGMYPKIDSSPVESRLFNKGMTAFDCVYNPSKTKFLIDAEKAGAYIISGEQMFYRQAQEQFKIFTGKKIDSVVKSL